MSEKEYNIIMNYQQNNQIKIKNPWYERKKEDKTAFYDLEIRSFEKIFIAVIYVQEENLYYIFRDSSSLSRALKKLISGGTKIVTFNGNNHDFPMLMKMEFDFESFLVIENKYTDFSRDILAEIEKNLEKIEVKDERTKKMRKNTKFKYPSLEELFYTHYKMIKKPYDTFSEYHTTLHCIEDIMMMIKLYNEECWKFPKLPYKDFFSKEVGIPLSNEINKTYYKEKHYLSYLEYEEEKARNQIEETEEEHQNSSTWKEKILKKNRRLFIFM